MIVLKAIVSQDHHLLKLLFYTKYHLHARNITTIIPKIEFVPVLQKQQLYREMAIKGGTL